MTEKDNWKYEFTDLPKYSDGREVLYLVTENQVPDYSVELYVINITNNYTTGKTSVTITKSLDDKNDKDVIRPESINVQLYADGEKSGKEIELNTENQVKYTRTGLDEKADGKTIVCVVKEVTKVAGYETVINNKNIGNVIITNHHKPKPDALRPIVPGTPGKSTSGSPDNGLSKTSNSIPKLDESINTWVVFVVVVQKSQKSSTNNIEKNSVDILIYVNSIAEVL